MRNMVQMRLLLRVTNTYLAIRGQELYIKRPHTVKMTIVYALKTVLLRKDVRCQIRWMQMAVSPKKPLSRLLVYISKMLINT